jgi:hypothetical protein
MLDRSEASSHGNQGLEQKRQKGRQKRGKTEAKKGISPILRDGCQRAAGKLDSSPFSIPLFPSKQLDWHTLSATTPVPAGEHTISLSFTNDYYDPPADRNLRIRSLTIRPVGRNEN